jgi:hypothetical protein
MRMQLMPVEAQRANDVQNQPNLTTSIHDIKRRRTRPAGGCLALDHQVRRPRGSQDRPLRSHRRLIDGAEAEHVGTRALAPSATTGAIPGFILEHAEFRSSKLFQTTLTLLRNIHLHTNFSK